MALGVAGVNGDQYDHVQIGGSAVVGGTAATNSLPFWRLDMISTSGISVSAHSLRFNIPMYTLTDIPSGDLFYR
jgi:hypothetical protein